MEHEWHNRRRDILLHKLFIIEFLLILWFPSILMTFFSNRYFIEHTRRMLTAKNALPDVSDMGRHNDSMNTLHYGFVRDIFLAVCLGLAVVRRFVGFVLWEVLQ